MITRARGTLEPTDPGLGTDDQRVHEFAEEVRRFMALVSSPAPDRPVDRARGLAQACAALYAGAAALFEIAVDEDDAIDEIPETTIEMTVMAAWTALGPTPTYLLMVEPFVDDEPARASLQDDLEEILAELTAGLVIHDNSPERWRAAVIEWRMDFAQGWGRHLAAVLYAAHCALAAHDATPDR